MEQAPAVAPALGACPGVQLTLRHVQPPVCLMKFGRGGPGGGEDFVVHGKVKLGWW